MNRQRKLAENKVASPDRSSIKQAEKGLIPSGREGYANVARFLRQADGQTRTIAGSLVVDLYNRARADDFQPPLTGSLVDELGLLYSALEREALPFSSDDGALLPERMKDRIIGFAEAVFENGYRSDNG